MGAPIALLGLNAWHGDSAACLVVDGEVAAAAEEERFRRVKHWAGFPAEAARWCLRDAGLAPGDLAGVCVNREPRAQLLAKLAYTLRRRPDRRWLADRLANARALRDLRTELRAALEAPLLGLAIHRVEHHRAHLASAFFASPWKEAAVVSVDGFGDFASAAWGRGRANELQISGRVRFPHSLGQLYLAVTQYLGFWSYGDEYKVMGLAAHGRAERAPELARLIHLGAGGTFRLDLRYFRHHAGRAPMTWSGGAPHLARSFSPALEELLGPARRPEERIEPRHMDVAAALQRLYERALFHLLRHVAARTAQRRLCLAGGCAMNGLANGRIVEHTPFEEVWIPPAPGDAGGALGAALSVWHERLGGPRRPPLRNAALGPAFDGPALEACLDARAAELAAAGCRRRLLRDPEQRCAWTAERLAAGAVVGWFQGRMEWGPRALGHRSILADPRRSDVRELLNGKIKLRESFRPFAPSVLRERVPDWFDRDGESPFMLQVWRVRAERRAQVPAITHADGTGRLQTVAPDVDPLYHRLIECFEQRTGIPMLLNTSFNENEPVVCRPEEALDCFLRTRMDALVLGPYALERPDEAAAAA